MRVKSKVMKKWRIRLGNFGSLRSPNASNTETSNLLSDNSFARKSGLNSLISKP